VKKHFAFLACVLLSGVSAKSHADLLDLNLSNDAVAAQYLIDMGQGFFAGGSALHEEDNGQVVSIDVLVRDDLRSGEHAFTAGVGGRLFGVIAEGDDNDGGSLALGGFVNYNLPNLRALAIRGEVFHGPSVTSMGEIDGITVYELGLDVEVIERAMLHAGYRKVRVDFGPASGDMDEGLNFGIKLEF
jgi:hypothetical protein